MYSHPETAFQLATEVQRQYLADAEQRRLLTAARRARRRTRRIARHAR